MINKIVFSWINNFAGQNVWLDRLGIFFADYSGYILVAVLIFLWFLRPKSRRFSLMAVIAAGISRGILTSVIRFFYHHPRPFETMAVHQLIPESGSSFPSGHAAFFFALSAPVYSYDKKLGTVFFIASALMGLARVYAGVHWPLDIIGGAVAGIIVGFLTYKLWPK